MRYPLLAQPLRIGGREVPNRIVMPPMVTYLAAADGLVNERVLDHYTACAGPGLVIVEATVVSPEGRLASRQLGIFDDSHLPGLAALCQRIQANGAVAAIQIHHAGRQTTLKNTYGLPLLAPSPVNPTGPVPLELTEEEIERIIACFVAGARRARQAGFDAVELHFAHGYLGSQFLSPAANRRTDRWGGDPERRARFPREVLRRVREEVGVRGLVYCRLGVVDEDPQGLPLAEGIQVAQWLEADGLPLLHISNGIGLPSGIRPEGSPFCDRLHLAGKVRQAVRVPVIGVGGIRTPAEAESALAAGLADLIAVGRGILADNAWAAKALSGREDTIALCQACRLCHHYRYPERCPARQAASAG